jgi:hypothetical protein
MNSSIFGSSGLRSVVHKSGHEGVIEIDPISGEVTTLLAERPEWAEGLTVAQITQRHKFYADRLQDHYSAEMKTPEVFAFEDLDWLGARPLPEDHDVETAQANDPNYDGFEHFELSADEEFRSNVVATVLGVQGDIAAIETELLEGSAFSAGSLTTAPDGSITLDLSEGLNADNYRSQEELEEMERQRIIGFNKAADEGSKEVSKEANGQ